MSEDNKMGTAVTFMVGAGVGAIAALLFAPKTGENLRSDIAEGVSEKGRQIRSKGKEFQQRIEKSMNEAQDSVQSAVEAGRNAYNDAKTV